MTSDQLLGGESFRFKDDKRPHVVFVIGEALRDGNHTVRIRRSESGTNVSRQFRSREC